MSGIFSFRFIARFIVTAAALGVLATLAVLVILWTGAISFAADRHIPGFAQKVIHWAFKQSVYARGPQYAVPEGVDLSDPGLIALGANHYAQNCTKCHGAPGLGQNPQVWTMEPRPQHLPSVLDQFSEGDLYYILQHGVMMSAMPAWPTNNRPDEPWATVAFLEAVKDGMTAEQYLELVTPEVAGLPALSFGATIATTAEASLPGEGETPWPEEYVAQAPASGFSDYALAGIPVAQCTACHGESGDGAPTGGQAPNLSILSADYIAQTLGAYATGQRHSGYMQVVAAALSPRQIEGLALYFSSLPETTLAAPMPADLVATGEQIATLGLPDSGTAACATCHVPVDMAGDSDAWIVPPLAGQTRPYIYQQLQLFQSGGRGSVNPWNPMRQVSHAMPEEAMRAVAAYYASLEPGSEPALTAGDPVAGAQLVAAVCSECHKADVAGVPTGEFPNLTLQGGGYVLTQLHAFHTDGRQAERMQQTAYRLSAEEMASLAAYIDALPAEARPGEPVPDAEPMIGGEIAVNGLPERGVPACLTCHSPEATAEIGAIPRLNGQYPKYLLHRLEVLSAERGRLAGTEEVYADPMYNYASALTEVEKASLAAYFAGLPVIEKRPATAN